VSVEPLSPWGYRMDGESQLKPVVRHPEMDKEMKLAIQENLEAVIPYFIARGGTSQENTY